MNERLLTRPQVPFRLAAELPLRLEFTGEFGAEINSFVPFIYWLHQAGLMNDRCIRTYCGMRPFYFFLSPEKVQEVNASRRFLFPEERPPWLPTRNDHLSRRSPFLMFPDYRGHFRDGMFDLNQPILVVHNKVTLEWGQKPINVLSLTLLDRLFSALQDHFHIVYVRPGLLGNPAGYSRDHQPDLPFGDLELLHAHRQVEIFDEIAAALAHHIPYNETKLRLYAHSNFHITVQGGNAHLLSLFSGGMVAILHRAGQETRHSYARGHFRYAAAPPPQWLICRSEADVESCIPLFRDAGLVEGQVVLERCHAGTMQRLSPTAQLEFTSA
jgi:hypothetical protein